MSNQEKPIPDQLEDAVSEMCDHYCKFPEQWDGDPDEFHESEICRKCPLTKVIMLSMFYKME